MTIDFFDPGNRFSYASRTASSEWKALMQSVTDLRDIDVADIGCGGGIYSRAMAEMGARVTGVDFSGEMLAAARRQRDGASDPVDSGRRRRHRPAGFVLRPGIAAGGDSPLLRGKDGRGV
jgi:SAM-dependent methyltransferase